MKKSKKTLALTGVLVLVLVAIDQLTKILATMCLKDQKPFVIWDGVFELHYLENQSAAFGTDFVSILQKIFKISYFTENPDAFLMFKMGFFTIITILIVIFLYKLYCRIPVGKRYRFLDWICVGFCAGAIGNLIDRIWHNYVVDFFYFKLINFPIFNVADIYVTVSAFALIVFGFFYYKEEDYELIIPTKKKKG